MSTSSGTDPEKRVAFKCLNVIQCLAVHKDTNIIDINIIVNILTC